MKRLLACLLFPLPLLLSSGCSNLDLAGGSVSDATGLGDKTPDYVDAEPERVAQMRQERLAEMLAHWEKQRLGMGAQDYIAGEDDVLDFSVFGLQNPEEAYDFTLTVNKEGKVDLPLVGELKVSGLNTADIKKAIRDVYHEKFIRNPRVTVSIKEYKSSPVIISGAVSKPGVYFLTHNSSTILEILSMANGLTEDAGTELTIVRTPRAKKGETPSTNTIPETAVTLGTEGEQYDFSVYKLSEVATNALIAAEDGNNARDQERLVSETDVQAEPGKNKRRPGGLFGWKGRTPDAEVAADAATVIPETHSSEAALETPANPTPPPEDIPASASASEDPATAKTIVVNLERLVDSGDLTQNVTITGGDQITVPTRKSEYVYVMGYVSNPGAVEIPKGNRVRELWAVAKVGGLSSSARPQNCMLIRQRNAQRIPVDLRSIVRGAAPPLWMEPGDTLIVGSSALMKMVEYIKPSVGAGLSASPVP